jgi:DNA polymerase I-like protein with 3'-5' exonuclease and polymerase domains
MFPDEWRKGTERGCTFPKKCKCKAHQDVTGLPYYNAKKQNFMLAYGGGVKRFSEISGYDLKTSKLLVKKHQRAIKKIDRYLERNGSLAVRNGVAYSADPYKRRIILRGQAEWQVRNQGKNYPIQSAGANMLKLAMISMPEDQIVLPFHDELVIEVPTKEAKKAAAIMQDVMEQSAAYITGIKGLIKIKPRIAQNFAKEK